MDVPMCFQDEAKICLRLADAEAEPGEHIDTAFQESGGNKYDSPRTSIAQLKTLSIISSFVR